MAAERRKIRQLEEDLDLAEKAKKRLERENKRLERDFKELQEQHQNLEKTHTKDSWNAKRTEAVLDNKFLERNTSQLQEEVDRLKKELKDAKDKTNQLAKREREELRTDIEATAQKRQFDEYKLQTEQQLASEREKHQEEIAELQQQLEKFQQPRRAGQVGGRRSARGAKGNGGLDALLKEPPATSAEIKNLQRQLDHFKLELQQTQRASQKERMALEDQLKTTVTLKDRAETKVAKLQQDSIASQKKIDLLTRQRDEETAAAQRTTKELRSANRLQSDLQSDLQRLRALQQFTEQQKDELQHQVIAAGENDRRSHRDELRTAREMLANSERQRQHGERQIASLTRQLAERNKEASDSTRRKETQSAETREAVRQLEELRRDLTSSQSEWDRERRRLERRAADAEQQAKDDVERLKDELRRSEEKRKREQQLAEQLQIQASENLARARDKTSSSLESVKVQSDKLKSLEKEKEKKLEVELQRLKDTMALKEKQHADQVDELQHKLRDKEKALQRERERQAEDEKEKDKDLAAEKKRLLEKDSQRSEELERLRDLHIDDELKLSQLNEQVRKLTESLRQAEFDLEDEKEERKLDNDKSNVRIKNLQEEVDDVALENQELASELKKTEMNLREKEDELIQTQRDLEDTKSLLEDANILRSELEETLDKVQKEAKQKEESLQSQLEVALNEAQDESKEKERQSDLRAAAERRVEELEWYFLDTAARDQRPEMATPAIALLRKLREEREAELESIRRRHPSRVTPLDNLHQRLVGGLQELPDANKEAMAYQLQGLMQALEAADFPILVRMDISVALVEGLVDPEILRELRLLTEYMVDESLHFMDTPETVVRLAQRDVDDEKASPEYQMKKRSDLLTFRDALLNRLAKMRSRRMNRPKREVLQGILDEIYTRVDG